MSTDQIYRLEYTPGVDAQIESALRWWVKHRDKAPRLLVREIERALALIAATPEIGQRAKTSQFGRLHRKRKSDHCYRCERCTGAQVHQVEICGALA